MKGAGVATLATAGVLVLLAGCGAPSGGELRPLTEVPYNLMSPATAAPSSAPGSSSAKPLVFLVKDDVLLPAAAPIPVGADDPSTVVGATLAKLAEGPGEAERARGLSTALGPDVGIALRRIDGATAVIDISAGDQAPTAGRLPLAVGQVVLTAVSVPGIDSVLLTAEGKPIEAPLPGGALTGRALVAGDYDSLVEPGAARSGG
jgi:hypothetical protein